MTEAIKYIAPRLTMDRFKEAEHTRCVYAMTPAINTTVEHLLKPEYWSLVAARLHPTARIEVISEDNAWFAELLVISNGSGWAKVKLLRYVPLDDSAGRAPAIQLEKTNIEDTTSGQLTVQYAGVKARHRVVRKSDKEVLKDGFPTNAEAVKWMQEYELNNLIAA